MGSFTNHSDAVFPDSADKKEESKRVEGKNNQGPGKLSASAEIGKAAWLCRNSFPDLSTLPVEELLDRYAF